MKKYLSHSFTCLGICLISIFSSNGQSENLANKITFALVMPDEISGGLSETHLQRLHDKFVDALTENGIASLNVQNNLVLYPIIKIYNE